MSKVKFNWILIIGLLMLFALLYWGITTMSQPPAESITYEDFLAKLDQPGEVTSVIAHENINKDSSAIIQVTLKDGKNYKAYFPAHAYSELFDKAKQAGLFKIKPQPPSYSWIWWMLGFVVVYVLITRWGSARQVNGAKTFAKSLARSTATDDKPPRERFDDVAGIDEVKEELQDIVDFLKHPEKYQKLGARIPRGVLLSGPPGTGKTLLAKAIAGEAGVPFFHMSGSEFVEMFVGVGASRVRDLFARAKHQAPSILFIDEIDAVGRHRGSGLGNAHDEREQTLNQIFVEMDGFDPRTNVIVIAATNRPDILDPALLRPGRFDKKVVVNRPDVRGREAILRVHTNNKPLAGDVNLEVLAKSLPGVSGADLENMTNEAAIIAAKDGVAAIAQAHFFQAVDRILLGKGRKLVMSANEKELVAFHEVGHTVVSKSLPGADPVRKISITARETSLGQTLSLPDEDRHLYRHEYLLNFISELLGGRAAEEIFCKTKSTGAEDDLRKATDLAQKMVCEWGMSSLGPRVFGAKEEEIFLGREVSRKEDVSPQTLKRIDDEVDKIIREGYAKARDILTQRGKEAGELFDRLLAVETLGQEEIEAVCPQIK
ncbi:MAG: ATP-dependent zinc metalloprotease FtsH [Candidatus Nealsonbacteria bacterium]|nr:ATP-dependent zinc metalloprotease FtsH [Candidatus Nealsonbacteria bacterium]